MVVNQSVAAVVTPSTRIRRFRQNAHRQRNEPHARQDSKGQSHQVENDK